MIGNYINPAIVAPGFNRTAFDFLNGGKQISSVQPSSSSALRFGGSPRIYAGEERSSAPLGVLPITLRFSAGPPEIPGPLFLVLLSLQSLHFASEHLFLLQSPEAAASGSNVNETQSALPHASQLLISANDSQPRAQQSPIPSPSAPDSPPPLEPPRGRTAPTNHLRQHALTQESPPAHFRRAPNSKLPDA